MRMRMRMRMIITVQYVWNFRERGGLFENSEDFVLIGTSPSPRSGFFYIFLSFPFFFLFLLSFT